jgi:hypothetical protein
MLLAAYCPAEKPPAEKPNASTRFLSVGTPASKTDLAVLTAFGREIAVYTAVRTSRQLLLESQAGRQHASWRTSVWAGTLTAGLQHPLPAGNLQQQHTVSVVTRAPQLQAMRSAAI